MVSAKRWGRSSSISLLTAANAVCLSLSNCDAFSLPRIKRQIVGGKWESTPTNRAVSKSYVFRTNLSVCYGKFLDLCCVHKAVLVGALVQRQQIKQVSCDCNRFHWTWIWRSFIVISLLLILWPLIYKLLNEFLLSGQFRIRNNLPYPYTHTPSPFLPQVIDFLQQKWYEECTHQNRICRSAALIRRQKNM